LRLLRLSGAFTAFLLLSYGVLVAGLPRLFHCMQGVVTSQTVRHSSSCCQPLQTMSATNNYCNCTASFCARAGPLWHCWRPFCNAMATAQSPYCDHVQRRSHCVCLVHAQNARCGLAFCGNLCNITSFNGVHNFTLRCHGNVTMLLCSGQCSGLF